MKTKNKEKRSGTVGNSLGTGYVTVIMIFVVICLAVLAALSFKTVMNNSGIGEVSRKNTALYYSAEERANRRLADLDGAAAEAERIGDLSLLADRVQSYDDLTTVPDAEGFRAEWSEDITEKLKLRCSVLFYSDPAAHDGHRFEIKSWKTDVGTGSDEVHITVWDGSQF
ncbi:MAG: hypothetical protein IJ784_08880 [Ruminiclostridium sp.]|nr:hypothetical protein [Ruminiclostridium sp.]